MAMAARRLAPATFSLIDQGADMAALTERPGLWSVDVMAYSMGDRCRVPACCAGTPPRCVGFCWFPHGYAQDGFYAEMLPHAGSSGSGAWPKMMKDTPMYKGYVAVAPKPEDFPKLLDQMGAFMRKPYDWSADVPSSPCRSCWSMATVTCSGPSIS